jgi:DNA-binding PadR family transcriptional regulator
MNRVQRNVLETILRHDGEYTWYQLDRALSESGTQYGGNLMQVLRGLVADGHIVTSPGPNPAQPLYWITESGKAALSNAGEMGTSG